MNPPPDSEPTTIDQAPSAPEPLRPRWSALLPILAVCIVGTLGGAWMGHAGFGLAIALAGIVVWQARQASRIGRVVRGECPPSSLPRHGTFGNLSRDIALHTRQNQQRTLRSHSALAGFRRTALEFPDPLVLIDTADRRVRWFNRAASSLLGLSRQAHLDAPFTLAGAPASLETWLGEPASDPLELPSPADPSRHMMLRMIPFSRDQHLLVAEDVTRVRRLEQVRRDFVANVSHELRTPLTVIHGYLDLLSPEDCPGLAPILPEMRSQSQRMTRIVEDLLTISRLEAQQELSDERVAMAAMLESLEREARALSRDQHHITCEDRLDLDLLGSSADLRSAFSNLVSNAVRYTPSGGSITIRLERHGDGARLSVTDTGHGIPAAHLPRLAERFYRVSASRSRERGGTGLGLSIVKHVLHLHGARLIIESEVGRGSTFSCQFDAARVIPRLAGASSIEPD